MPCGDASVLRRIAADGDEEVAFWVDLEDVGGCGVGSGCSGLFCGWRGRQFVRGGRVGGEGPFSLWFGHSRRLW